MTRIPPKIITTAVAILLPALGHAGMIGQDHINALISARAGSVTHTDGIITFPSFHTSTAALFVYSARNMKSLLALLVPANLLVILATPPCGGHYVVDTLAGLVVAVATVQIYQRALA